MKTSDDCSSILKPAGDSFYRSHDTSKVMLVLHESSSNEYQSVSRST